MESKIISWKTKSFDELTAKELYEILKLRNQIFVVEQNCPYQDCDEKDFDAFHICGWKDEQLIAYSRILPIGISYPDAASIGRVVVAAAERRNNFGKELMLQSIREVNSIFGKVPVKIGAQSYLKNFYESLSFIQVKDTEEYLEDGIPHITMELSRTD